MTNVFSRVSFIYMVACRLRLTTLSSRHLPLTLVNCEDADKVYSELLGSRLLAIPCGSEQRLKQWPGLASKDVTFKGVGWKECAVDIVLSSAGKKSRYT